MRFLVLGAGAIGSVFGGFLATAGHQVTLVGRQEHMDAIRNSGLLIDGIWGRHEVREGLTTTTTVRDAAVCGPFDLCLLTVKSYDTRSAVMELCDTFRDPPPVLSLQNGIGNIETIESLIGRRKTIGGRVIFGVEYNGPGHVTVTVAADATRIGGLGNGYPQKHIEALAACFTDAGIPTHPTDDIMRYVWGKVLYNCALNPLATLLEVHYGMLLSSESAKEIMRSIIAEIFDVARKRAVRLDWEQPQQYAEHLFSVLMPRTFEHHPSMLQDIRRGKRTEIEALNGAIAALGEELGCAVPYNTTIRDLIRARESLCRQPHHRTV